MEKIDFKKQLKHLYAPRKGQFTLVDVPPMNFLMIDGRGDPNTAESFQHALNALYSVTFTLKFDMKKNPPQDHFEFVVPPLQGLWWMEPGPFDPAAKDQWLWTLMIMQPDFITRKMIAQTIQTLKIKKPCPALESIRFQKYHEGPAVQTLYIGPYANEAPTIQKLHDFAQQNNCQLQGKHHEIYLSDPRRTDPAKLKTIIRQPVKKIKSN